MATYNKITPEIAEQLKAVVGDKRFSAGEEVDPNYSHDEMPIYGKFFPEVTVDVESTEEVSQIMKICNENHIPVTCRGAGTGLVGGCVPLAGGVVLCTRRMNKILHYDMDNLVVRIQPGVLLKDLAADALAHGLMYPPDPGEKTATVGGNISTNAGGMRAVKYGVTRDYVLAMTVVLADGRVIELGKSVSKTSSGYSLLHLMIGSEGTLGIITEMTMKLIPNPKCDVSCLVPFRTVEDCISFVPQIKLANLDPQSIEFMDADIVALVGLHAIDGHVREHRVLELFVEVFADRDVLNEEVAVILLGGKPLGVPVAVNADTHSDCIDFLSHNRLFSLVSFLHHNGEVGIALDDSGSAALGARDVALDLEAISDLDLSHVEGIFIHSEVVDGICRSRGDCFGNRLGGDPVGLLEDREGDADVFAADEIRDEANFARGDADIADEAAGGIVSCREA